ncbi:MFS transporter [Thermoleophilia bacterium SCSIO 60948]|nr:MFS transporter [Thermoleophilia bacterium SCSIO 60948]
MSDEAHTAATGEAAGEPGRGALALLRDRTFGPFFAGNLVSNAGNWIFNVTAAVVVYEMTGSATAVGLVTAFLWAGALVLQPWAGALTDRVDRRRMLIAGQVVSLAGALAVAVPILLGGTGALEGTGAWAIYLPTLVIGIGQAFSMPAMQALLPALVDRADLDQALALNSVTFNLGRALGPAVAGLLLLDLGPGIAFAANALSYAALVAVLVVIRPRREEQRPDGDRSVRAGFRWVRAHPRSMLLLASMVAIGFATDPLNTLTPALVALSDEPSSLVGLTVAAFGVGAVGVALGVERVRTLLGRERSGIVGLAVLATGIAALSLASAPGATLGSAALAGGGFIVAVTSVTAQLQRLVPDELRGRVMALWGVAFLGTRPLSATIDGALADLISARFAGLAMAAIAAAAAIALAVVRSRKPARRFRFEASRAEQG